MSCEYGMKRKKGTNRVKGRVRAAARQKESNWQSMNPFSEYNTQLRGGAAAPAGWSRNVPNWMPGSAYQRELARPVSGAAAAMPAVAPTAAPAVASAPAGAGKGAARGIRGTVKRNPKAAIAAGAAGLGGAAFGARRFAQRREGQQSRQDPLNYHQADPFAYLGKQSSAAVQRTLHGVHGRLGEDVDGQRAPINAMSLGTYRQFSPDERTRQSLISAAGGALLSGGASALLSRGRPSALAAALGGAAGAAGGIYRTRDRFAFETRGDWNPTREERRAMQQDYRDVLRKAHEVPSGEEVMREVPGNQTPFMPNLMYTHYRDGRRHRSVFQSFPVTPEATKESEWRPHGTVRTGKIAWQDGGGDMHSALYSRESMDPRERSTGAALTGGAAGLIGTALGAMISRGRGRAVNALTGLAAGSALGAGGSLLQTRDRFNVADGLGNPMSRADERTALRLARASQSDFDLSRMNPLSRENDPSVFRRSARDVRGALHVPLNKALVARRGNEFAGAHVLGEGDVTDRVDFVRALTGR